MKRGLVGQIHDARKLCTAYFKIVAQRLAAQPEHVPHANNTSKLGGFSLAQLVQQAIALLTPHASRKDNPHELTPSIVGSYSNAEFEAIVDAYVPGGRVNLSRYGTLDYLPAGVAGNFEGATTVKNTGNDAVNWREQYSMTLEANGNLVMLRNGTNGSVQGVYYSYVPQAGNTFTGKKVVNTGRKYTPPYLPTGQTVAFLYQGGQNVLAGRFQDSLGALKQCFIVPTNGTLNDSAHQQCILLDGSWDATLVLSEVVQTKDYFYILVHGNWPAAANGVAVTYQLYRVPVSALGSGAAVTPTRVTVGQCTGWLGKVFNTGDITLGDVYIAKDAVTSAPIQHINGDNSSSYFSGTYHIGGAGRPYSTSMVSPDGTKIRFMINWCPRFNAQGKGFSQQLLMFSFVLDLSTLTVALDSGITPAAITLTAGNLVWAGTCVDAANANYISSSTNSIANDRSFRMYLSERGIGFSSAIPYGSSSWDLLYRVVWDNMGSVYDQLKMPSTGKVPSLRQGLTNYASYGSPLGDAYDGFRLLPNNKAIVVCRASNLLQSYVRYALKAPGADLSTNYAYQSVSRTDGLTIPGYAPTTDRVNLGTWDNATLQDKLIGLLYEMDDTSVKKFSGAVFHSDAPNTLTRFTAIDDELVTTGTISVTQSQLDALKIAACQLLGWDTSATVANKIVAELVVPQNTAIPAWVQIWYSGIDFSVGYAVLSVNPSSRSGAIATLELGQAITKSKSGTSSYIPGLTTISADVGRQGTHYVYELSDCYLIVGNGRTAVNHPTGSSYRSYRFLINKADGSIQNGAVLATSVGNPGDRFGGLPGYGVGYYTTYDLYCKTVFIPTAKTKAAFAAYAKPASSTSYIVVTAQEVARGFILYFTEETPVIINSYPGSLPVSSIDLATIKANPANTTFYVYAERNVDGSCQYGVYTTVQPRSADTLYLGTAVTGVNGISQININKLTEFGGLRLSQTPAGSSMPVSPGLPSQVGAIDSGWWNS